jgi:hypothetical protein
MSSINLLSMIPLEFTVAAVAAFVAVTALRLLRARGKARKRIVEKPNSHYTSQLARNNESKHRWSNIALDRMHEVNRAEVERLLARVEATSVDALRPNERAFLDRMAELASAAPPIPPPGKERSAAPDLRHRPAT